MKPYGQKKNWSESDLANKANRGNNRKDVRKRKTRYWKKRARKAKDES